MRKIISVQYRRGNDPNEFGGRDYSYYSDVGVNAGDVIIVPAGKGETVARVSRTDVRPSEIDVRVEPYMKTITELAYPAGDGSCAHVRKVCRYSLGETVEIAEVSDGCLYHGDTGPHRVPMAVCAECASFEKRNGQS